MIADIRRVAQRAVLCATTKQEMFADFLIEQVGEDHTWAFDHGVLAFESAQGRIFCDTQPICSIAVEPTTLLWRWAPMGTDNSYYNPAAVNGYRSFGQRHQLPAFITLEVPYEVGKDQQATIAHVGHDVIGAGYEIFGLGATFYQAPFNDAGSRIVWALDNVRTESGPVELPTPQLNDVLVKLPRLIVEVDDVGWSLGGIAAKFPGMQCVIENFIPERRTVATLTEASGQQSVVTVEVNATGQVTRAAVQMSGGASGAS